MLPGWNPSVMFSPDGTYLAFDYEVDGTAAAFVRRIDELEQQPLGGVANLGSPASSAGTRGDRTGRRHGAGRTQCAERPGSTFWPVRAVALRPFENLRVAVSLVERRRCSGPS
jgi:hypothetical protein